LLFRQCSFFPQSNKSYGTNRLISKCLITEILVNYNIVTTEHFYHFGGKEENRNAVTEALILNYSPPNAAVAIEMAKQMSLFAQT